MTEDRFEKHPSVEVRHWIRRGIVMVNAEALDYNDPDHVYNQIKAQGQRPEDYGYEHPLAQEFGHKKRSELIDEIFDLRKEINSIYRAGLA